MRISSQNNQIYLNLPQDFIEPWLEQQFLKLMDKNYIPYDSVISYINSTIKEIGMGAINYDGQQQTLRRGKKVNYKDSKSVFDTFSGELDITFRSVDSLLNYFMLVEIFNEYYLNNQKHSIEMITFDILDKDGDLIYTVIFREVFLKSLSEYRAGYNMYDIVEKTFNVSFKYNFIDIRWRLDEKDRSGKSIFDIPIVVKPAPPLPKHINILPPENNNKTL